MIVADHVFAPDEDNYLPIIPRHTVLTEYIIGRLWEYGVVKVAVREPGDPEDETGEELELPPIAPMLDEKLRDEAVSGIRRMFDAVGSGEENMTTAYQAVREIGEVVDRLVDTLSSESGAFVHIADLKSYDEYTYHHSLSVAVLSIAIGQNLMLSDGELRELGRCAMLHDIGKTLVPVELINKPSKLTDEEFMVIKQHPRKGYDYLKKTSIGDEKLRQGVLTHHEKLNGAGYPIGLNGNSIPLMGRIISIADIYDAVTSYRSYRAPMPPGEAIELIKSEIGRAFDYELVKAFIEKLEPHPLNTVLELSDGRRGVVIGRTGELRPVLRMLDNGEKLDLMDRGSLSLVIMKVIDGRGGKY